MIRCVALLQNAWSGAYAGSTWPRDRWLWALDGSWSGQRLGRILPAVGEVGCEAAESVGVWFDNTTPAVSEEPSGVCPIDWDHVRGVFGRARAEGDERTFVLACGQQAQLATRREWAGRYLLIPHPAWRFFSEEMVAVVRQAIERDGFQRAKLETGPRQPPRLVHEFTGPFATGGPGLFEREGR
jgi:hypothetical protein